MAQHKIELLNVKKSFSVGNGVVREVVADISFKAKPGEFISVIGPSGCGKSTVFNIMAGLEPPTSGHVLVDGRDRTGDCTPFAYMPQKDLLFPWRTILENTTLGLEIAGMKRKEAKHKARALFPAFGLGGFEDTLPFELSGGMRQRAAFLRTVVLGRDILLLDEPFGALDSLTRIEMQTWLQDVWSAHAWTAVMITHDVHEAIFLSDRVVVLGARPTHVCLDLAIDLPRPRTLAMTGTREFSALEEQLLETLHRESRKALSGISERSAA